jgi:hypothetical protein
VILALTAFRYVVVNEQNRILGTPNEEVWPGVSGLPDYKPTFPQWSRQDIARVVPTLDDQAIDMLKVRIHCSFLFAAVSFPQW